MGVSNVMYLLLLTRSTLHERVLRENAKESGTMF